MNPDRHQPEMPLIRDLSPGAPYPQMPQPVKPWVRGAPKPGTRAPLNRADLDRAAPWFRAALGLVLVMWSAYTTIQGVALDFGPLLTGNVLGLSMVLLVGALLAAGISIGQWFTSEHAPLVYTVLILIDSRYTQMQLGPLAETLVAYHLPTVTLMVAQIISVVLSWGLALLIARYGEILLLGRRR